MSVQEICRVAENTQLGDGLFLMVLHAPKITELAQCGQFVHIACGEGHLLRRPISICAWKAPELRIVFQVKGEGTKWLSERRTGDELDVLGPLGHGFDVGALGSAPVFIGGGIVVPPMLGCVREAVKRGAKPAAILGFRNKGAVILEGDFRDECETFVTTDDGSYARHGFVTDVLKEQIASASGGLRPEAHAEGHRRHREAGRRSLPGFDGGAHGLRHRRVPRLRVRAQGEGRRNPLRSRLQGRSGIQC